jgi:phosphate transport system substrate-binding protein|tara:strand:- start:4529 stop:5554 length:1026 start_codon:yes stop_codon:yes gene_type:complete
MYLRLLTTAVAILITTLPALARNQINIVGSSTVFPFSTTVAERFGKSTEFKTPVVESTGSGGGMKLFCSGVGENTPDITNASRRIKSSEAEKCAANGVTPIEAKIGFDGIVLANSRTSGRMEITRKQIFLALAKNIPNAGGEIIPNPYSMWSEIDSSLPAVKIEVLGPPPTSGTRDAFAELALEGGCKKIDFIKAMKKVDKSAYKALCHTIREDGAYIEAGENDNLIVQKLQANPAAFGVFGYSFLDQNSDTMQGSIVGGIKPEFEEIASGNYPIARSLYFYVKKEHIDLVPGITEFMKEFTEDDTWGEDGYLVDKGLIPMSENSRKEWAKKINGLMPLEM